jgi:hypothetical protein
VGQLAVSAGGSGSSAFYDEANALANSPLSEDAGEGLHRLTHLTCQRGEASKTPWVLASIREKQNFQMNRTLVQDHGERGKLVFDFEWRQFKRCVRPTLEKKWKSVRLTDKEFYEKLYGLDDGGDDWAELMGLRESRRSSSVSDGALQVKHEYARHVFKPGEYYSVPVKMTETEANGAVTVKTEVSYFHLLTTEHGSTKSKTLKTLVDPVVEEEASGCPKLHLQYLDVWAQRPDGSVTAFFHSDPQWVLALNLGSFPVLTQQLMVWDSRLSDTDGCVDLCNGRSAAPDVATIHDATCPTAVVLEEMHRLKWQPFASLVVHSAVPVVQFDQRSPLTKKYYYQVLLRLGDVLRNNPSIRSDQPQSYYKLLLKDRVVASGLGDAAYIQMLKALGETPADAGASDPGMLALPAPPKRRKALAIMGSGQDEFDVGDHSLKLESVAKSKPRAKAKPNAKKVAKKASSPSDTSSLTSSSSSSNSSSGDSSSDSSESFDLGDGDRSRVSRWTKVPGGSKFKIDFYAPVNQRPYRRYILQCQHHHGCERKRNVNQTRRLGRLEPLCFLSAWNELGADVAKEEHSKREFHVPNELVENWFHKIGTRLDSKLDAMLD